MAGKRRNKHLDLEREIRKYLESRNIFHYRQASGVSSGLGGHSVGPKGAPRIVCVIDGQYVGIRVAAPYVKESKNQATFRQSLEAAGGKYIVASSVDDVKKEIEPAGSSQ
jgi:hypothetical protein